MGSDDQKARDLTKQQQSAESSVLDFLDREIATSIKSQDDPNAQQDDVEVLVDSLLKQAITASDEEAIPQSGESEDLNSLFAAIFRSEEEISETKPKDAVPAMDARPSRTLEEVGVEDRESVNLRSVDQTAVLAPSSRAPRRRGLVLALSGALICLLAGVGVVYFTGTKGNPLDKPNRLPQTPSQVSPAKAETAELLPLKPSPEARAEYASADAAHLARSASAPSAAGVGKNAKSPESSKQTRPAITEPPAPTQPPSTGAGGNTQVDAAEKAITPTAPAADKPAANLPSRTTENAAPPPPVQTQASPIQALPNPVSPVLPGLEHLAAPGKPPVQPAPSPRNVTQAVAISRVAPMYPEIARKTHTTGTVVVEVAINEQGRVVKATAESGPAMLRDEAVRAAMQWRFKPASIGGTNVPSTIKITIVFTNPQL